MAAMGETYVCNTEKTAALERPFGFSGHSVTESNLTDWVIDTDSGIRKLLDGRSYDGECKNWGIGIFCSDEKNIDGNGALFFYMRFSDMVFTSSLLGLGPYVISDIGTCTEI